VTIVRTDRRSWIAIAITGFGAFILRYLRVVRERGRSLRFWSLLLVLVVVILISLRFYE
jgi:hypothetical protein